MVTIDNDFIRGVIAAASWAHENYEEPIKGDIVEAVLSEAVIEKYEEVI